MLRQGLVENVPDAGVIVAVGAAGEGDLGAGGHQNLVLGAAAGGEEIAAINKGRSEGAMVDFRARARPPG